MKPCPRRATRKSGFMSAIVYWTRLIGNLRIFENLCGLSGDRCRLPQILPARGGSRSRCAHIAPTTDTKERGNGTTRVLEERRGGADGGGDQAPVRLAGRQQ